MASNPWYARYVGDWRAKTAHLSLAEKGVYGELLDQYFATAMPLPSDWVKLCRVVGANPVTEITTVKAVMAEFFTLEKDGLWHNKRADSELKKQRNFKEEQSRKGKLSAAARWGNPVLTEITGGVTEGVTESKPDCNLPQPQPHTTATTTPTKPRSTPLVADATGEQFETAWNRYPKRSGNNPKRDALEKWRARVLEGVPTTAMLAGVERYRAWCEHEGKIGTELVMQAVRFFGRSRPFEQDFEIPKGNGNGNGNGNGKFNAIAAGRESYRRAVEAELATKTVDSGALPALEPDLPAKVHERVSGK